MVVDSIEVKWSWNHMVQRFLDKVEVNNPASCWKWRGAITRAGYGYFSVQTNKKVGKKCRGAHRVSYALFKGEIPAGFFVMHECDDKLCVNPAHLRVGTPRENMEDCSAKGRRKTKLTPQNVLDIRRLAQGGATQRALAKQFNVSKPAIHVILHRRKWAWLKEEEPLTPPRKPVSRATATDSQTAPSYSERSRRSGGVRQGQGEVLVG